MFENPSRGRQARNFTTNVPKILDLKSSSEQIFPENRRWVPLCYWTFVLRITKRNFWGPRVIKFSRGECLIPHALRSSIVNPGKNTTLGTHLCKNAGYGPGLLMRTVVQEMQMRCTEDLSLRLWSHKIWACPDNTATNPVNLGIFEAQHQTYCNRIFFNII